MDIIRQNDVTVLIGETGSGKTTRTSHKSSTSPSTSQHNTQRSRNISSKLASQGPA